MGKMRIERICQKEQQEIFGGYATPEAARSLRRAIPKALGELETAIQADPTICNSEGIIAVGLACPCCSRSVSKELSQYEARREQGENIYIVSPLPGISCQGRPFDFLSETFPEYSQALRDGRGGITSILTKGNTYAYITEFVEGVMQKIKERTR